MVPQDCIAELASHFNAGRYALVIESCTFPLPVYVDGAASELMSHIQLWAFFQSLHSRMIAAGAPRLTGNLASIEAPRGGRNRMKVDWMGVGDGLCLPVMQTICYNRETTEHSTTEMLQINVIGDLRLASLLRAA